MFFEVLQGRQGWRIRLHLGGKWCLWLLVWIQRIAKRMKDLAAVWNRDLLSEVLIFFTLVLSSMNLISCSLIDTNFGFGPLDLVCWTSLLEFLSNVLVVIHFLYSIIFVIFHNGNIKGNFLQFLVCRLV